MVEVLQPRNSANQKFGLSKGLPLSRAAGPQFENAIDQWNMVNPNQQIDEGDALAVLDFIQDEQQRGQLQRNLTYLQKRERISYRVQVWPDGFLHRAGQEFPHESPANERELYAMDDMELLYTANAPALGGTFHHSSFLSGKPVLCAGEIEIRNGRVRYVDNGSGHYRPTTQQLLQCLNVLENRYRVDLNSVQIMDHSQLNAQWQSAAIFKSLGGAPMPQKPAHLRN